MNNKGIEVSSEIGTLQRVIVHSPDGGLGKVIPTKAQDWLFEDIVHLESMRKNEYDYYIKILLYFLDTKKVKNKIQEIDHPENNRGFYKPDHPNYFNSDKVLEPQFLLSQILENREVRLRLVASCCAHEKTSYLLQDELLELPSMELAKTLISGIVLDGRMVFPPIPNFIFTRDIGITVNNHLLLSRPATRTRTREAIITRFIVFNHPIFEEAKNNIIEISSTEDYFLLDDEEKDLKRVTAEGGDIMMVAPNHLLIGVSERTTTHAANQIMRQLFKYEVVDKVTVLKIPQKRAYMHIDTTFTQVKRNLWVLFAPFSKYGKEIENRDLIPSLGEANTSTDLEILQFHKDDIHTPKNFPFLEDLLDDISQNDLNSSEPTEFIYSGDGEFPFGQREQWTDSCNVLALKEGVVIGYDRNDRTANGFKKKGFNLIHAADLLDQFERGETSPEEIKNTLILLPSAELSRARGGSHCLSMPILRESII